MRITTSAMTINRHSRLVAGEQAHRRTLLLCVGVLILLSTSPVFGHHLAMRADAVLAGHDHIGSLCLIALHELLAPVHTTFHLLLLCGILYAMFDRARALRALRSTLRNLEVAGLVGSEAIALAAGRVGLSLDRLCVVRGLPNPAFTTGLWRPRVYVDSSLAEALDTAELEAVLAHESAHVARRDPLRLSLLRFLACALFYLPALRRLSEDLTDEAEILADDAATSHSEPLALASAILALASWGVPSNGERIARTGAVVAFQPFVPLQRADLLERRIHRLAGEPSHVGTHVTRRSLGGVGAMLAAVWISGLMMAHPLPSSQAGAGAESPHAHMASHCRHAGATALSHLFCFGLHASGSQCPHTGR